MTRASDFAYALAGLIVLGFLAFAIVAGHGKDPALLHRDRAGDGSVLRYGRRSDRRSRSPYRNSRSPRIPRRCP
jgi:hypothetical protein